MDSSFKNLSKEDEEIPIEELPEFLELVRKIAIVINGGEYLNCKGVFEGNVKSLARDLRKIIKEKSERSTKEAMEIMWKRFMRE